MERERAMKILPLLYHVWTLLGFLMFFLNSSYSFLPYSNSVPAVQSIDEPSISMTYNYDRIDEVRKECKSILSSASEFKPDNYRAQRIKNELSFINGDWDQDSDKAPLLPFDYRDMPNNGSDIPLPLKLASFWVTDVDSGHQSKNSVSVSGLLYLGISRNGSFGYKPQDRSPKFSMWLGQSELTIFFQGLYVESKENGGERIMCLLGNTMLPSREPDSSDPWEWMKSMSYQPPLLQDDQILLVLRYPNTFTLTTREIRGEMKSLNKKSNLKYFDNLHISTQFGANVIYEYGSKELVSKACNPYPFRDKLVNNEVKFFKGFEFCSILERFASSEVFVVVPNWRCSGTDEYCSKLGPFVSGRAIKATDGGFNNVKLIMQDVRCEPKYVENNGSSARVSSVFRAVPPLEYQFIAQERTGLNNMTLRAEGIWNSSSGQLCMIGCLGPVSKGPESCNSRICLYIPLEFSISQRSVVFGSISIINNSTNPYFPLSLERVMRPSELWERITTSYLSYKYSKLESAGAFLERSEPFDFRTVIKKSFLSYPTLEDEPTYMESLSILSEDLTLQAYSIEDTESNYRRMRTSVEMEILSIGPLFGHYWPSRNISTSAWDVPFRAKAESTEKQLLVNVSAQLTLDGNRDRNISVLFLEGYYDSRVGKMYLIGCRDIRASWKILSASADLENGLDCLIEVKLEYPPTTARWLINPTAKISISSRRPEDDPLYFKQINIQTLPILYRKQREDILSRRGVEGILRILTLSLAIACILSQLFYIRDKVDEVSYISLVMLGVQALGYSIPLITGAEALFGEMANETEHNEISSFNLQKNQWYHVLDYVVKLLVLVTFLLTLRLCQKVWKSRIRLLTRTPLEPGRVPSDKRVFFATLAIHVVGFIIVLVFHSVNVGKSPIQTVQYMDPNGNTHPLRQWEIKLEEYVGLVQDFFLLPQVIGNFLWQINCYPLRKFYFVGITLVRLLPHVYDYIRTPVFNPYFSEEYEFVNPSLDFYSRFGDIAIPVFSILLAIIVYIQQRWSYQKIAETINRGNGTLIPMATRGYERLSSKSFEAELVSGTNETGHRVRGQETEE